MAANGNSSNYLNIPINDDNENDNENDLPDYFQAEKPAVVFCIDGGKGMLQAQQDQSPPIDASLQCVRQFIRNHIFASLKCFCALNLVGCKKSENPIKLKHIVTVSSMKFIGADIIKDIDSLIDDVEEGKYEDNYGFGDFSLSDTLWCAANTLSQLKGKIKKKIVIFTNEDDPFKGSRLERVRAIAKVADFEKSKMELQVIAIGKSFDFSKCYKEILELSGDRNPNLTTCTTTEEMLNQCKTAKHRHVALANIPLYISDDLFIDVSVNYLAKAVKTPTSTKLHMATNAPVTSTIKKYNVTTGEVVEPTKIVQYEEYAGHQLYFLPEETKEMNEKGERRLKLLGFKPKSVLSLEHYVKPGAFVYPSDARTKGSTSLFSALLQRCHYKNVVAICTYCPRPTSTVRFVALVPQLEERFPNGRQKIPPGFRIVILPFGDEIRDWDESCTNKDRAVPEQVELMKAVIKKMMCKYDPDKFPCPKLAKHWAGIEALALDLPKVEDVQDFCIPNYPLLAERLGDLPQRVKDEIYSSDYCIDAMAPKKDMPINVSAVEDLARKRELYGLKVEHLKGYLKAVGLGKGLSSMKKKDCEDKIYSYLKM